MSESRGLTLRKKKTQKRPVISAPQQQQRPTATSTAPSSGGGAGGGPVGPISSAPAAGPNTTLRPPKERAAPSETSDLVKRRYSTRYNQLPQFGGSDVPDVPALPGAGANAFKRRSHGSPSRPTSSHARDPLKVDQQALADPNLQHEQYVTRLLSNASEEDIQEYQHNLNRVKRRNSMDLKQSIYQNRAQFIRISKEAESLKTEQNTLRTLMGELTAALEQSSATLGHDLTAASSSAAVDGATRARKNANRSSLANLEAMWNTQLQALWKNVEKSQKFLPAVPGRHVVMENANWIELDSATWKPKRPVHIFLLNDHLLVASKKRKKIDPNLPQNGPAPTKLVAEECWPLADIDAIDMAAAGQTKAGEERMVASAITIRLGNKSWIYRHEKKDVNVKNDVITQVRKTQDELRKANLPSPGLDSARSNLDNLANTTSTIASSAVTNTALVNGMPSLKDGPEFLIEVDGKQQNLRWVESQIDSLDIEIASQDSETAVQKVEKLRTIAKGIKNNSIAQDMINAKVDGRAARLATVLCRELGDTPSFLESTKRTVSLLIRLGFEDRARQIYLTARGETLTKRQRQCVFDGDLYKYVFSVSYVYFTIIKNTVTIYQASFPPNTMSACISWAHDQLEVFNALLVRQLGAIEKGGKVWTDCMDVVSTHEKELLGEVGLDFREVIGRGLRLSRDARHEKSQSRNRARSKSRPSVPP